MHAQRLNQKEMENLSRSITSKVIESVIKSLWTRKPCWLNWWILLHVFFCFFFLNVILLLRERQRVSRRGGKGDIESEAGSRLWAVSTEPNMGLKLINHRIMTWAKVGGLTDCATQAPLDIVILYLAAQSVDEVQRMQKTSHFVNCYSCWHFSSCDWDIWLLMLICGNP